MSTSENQNTVAIAVIQTEMEYIKAAMVELKAAQAAQSIQLDQVLKIMAEARGGWRVLMLIGGASGAIGSAITWVLTHVKG